MRRHNPTLVCNKHLSERVYAREKTERVTTSMATGKGLAQSMIGQAPEIGVLAAAEKKNPPQQNEREESLLSTRLICKSVKVARQPLHPR